MLKLLGVRDQKGEEITHEEVETVLAEGTSAGLIEPAEQAMISEVLLLGDRPVRVAMTPRRDVHWLSIMDTPEQQRADLRACPYSRMVVVRGNDIDEPVGVIHKKDVLDAMLDGQPFDMTSLMVTPAAIPETTSVLRAFELLKQTPLHMALVVDEFGTLEGVVTATDLLEMIAGDFDEAHDDATPPAIAPRDDGSFLVDGRADIKEVAKALGATFDETGQFHTAAGLVLQAAGRLPEEGEIFRLGGFEVEVIDMDDRRIDKLLFRRVGKARGQSDVAS